MNTCVNHIYYSRQKTVNTSHDTVDFSMDNLVKKDLTMGGSSPYATPQLSPMSSFGDIQAGLNLRCWEDGCAAQDAGGKLKEINNESAYAKSDEGGYRNLISTSSSLDSNEGENKPRNGSSADRAFYCDPNKVEDHIGNNLLLLLTDFESDPRIWIPPEPENLEDDKPIIADNYQDDEYNNVELKYQNSLSCVGEHHGINNSHGGKRQKAMLEALSGQFKILVSRLLESGGVAFSGVDDGQSWVDIVSSISWNAALYVKPVATEGSAMDPGLYVKVKCIAAGSRQQSELIKGLVFKKNAAHKHMPTKFNNPRLLLLLGSLGHSAVGLSSFESLKQEKDYLRSITEMIESCHPNVVLIEKNISRDVQESLTEKGITVVSDLKLHRLERISLCTGSPIISCSNFPANLVLPKCNSFHIERFVEEHNIASENGKKLSKTLMFLEGFQKPLGCTILLKGADSDELKKVKQIVQYTVFAAYHLILEASFFADLRVLFSDNTAEGSGNLRVKALSLIGSDPTEYSNTTASENAFDIPICNGTLGVHNRSMTSSNSNVLCIYPDKSVNAGTCGLDSSEPFKSKEILLPLSTSHETLQGNKFYRLISESATADFVRHDDQNICLHTLSNLSDHEIPVNSITSEEKLDKEIYDNKKTGLLGESIEAIDYDACNTVKRKHKDDVGSVLDPRSILVLLSKQCTKKGTICEQSHLSRIKYYGYFDISLGRYLDILLDKNNCSSCGEPPEAHVYCYTHQNGNLSVHLSKLGEALPGEDEGKIWMWTHCLSCKNQNELHKRRVVLSSSARSLSFGKFLELSFSGHTAASRLSECGHLLHRDFLQFFGLGSKVALFVYSPVKIYAACKPPPVLEFYDTKGHEWFKRELEHVLFLGRKLFSEVSDFLQSLKPKYSGTLGKQYSKLSGLLGEFSEVEEMLLQEKADFEVSLMRAIEHSGQMEIALPEVLGLRWLKQELCLPLYIWDRRLDCLSQHVKFQQREDAPLADDEVPIVHSHEGKPPTPSGGHHSQDMQIHHVMESTETVIDSIHSTRKLLDIGFVKSEQDGLISDKSWPDVYSASAFKAGGSLLAPEGNASSEEVFVPISGGRENEHSAQIVGPHIGREVVAELKNDGALNDCEMSAAVMLNENSSILDDIHIKSEGPEEMIWAPLSDLRREYRKDLYGGSLQKFEFMNTYCASHFSPLLYQSSNGEKNLFHFSVGPGGNILSASKDEISSIIACALAIFENHLGLLNRSENEGREMNRSDSLTTDASRISAYLSSTGSLEFEGINLSHSTSSLSSDDSPNINSDTSLLSVDQLLASDNQHPEVTFGIEKVSGKSIFSVLCIYAKQFYTLRKKWCPTELAYIASLSHCKKWDAQGGKSKAFFAKTLDERFIIKQIKKTELDSFVKFGPDYFKHIIHSLDSGSQTCLAKIFGIYQVRHNKNGKEIKTDIMVMENLLYGHKISRTYDLKGAVFERYIPDAKSVETVLLDQNFVEDMQKSPVYLGGKTKHLLQRAIWNDTSFLTSINVMDYSLLVGVDDERRELVFGIIDYLRQYTWDKQLETWVKTSMVVPKNELPTVISPKEYKKRFRKFMARYFLAVPHCWNCEQCSPPCMFCVDGKRTLAKVHNAEL